GGGSACQHTPGRRTGKAGVAGTNYKGERTKQRSRAPLMARRIAVTTANHLAGHDTAEDVGEERGIGVRAQRIGRGTRAACASIFGGNIRACEEVCEQARSEAFARMVEHAQERGADAIIAMRYDATEFAQGITEVLAYGTAVKLRAHG